MFIASDRSFTDGPGGKLYKLDLANGSVMMEVDLSGGVPGALATDGSRLFMITDDGLVQCFDMRNFKKLWSVEVAPYSDSTPAVDGGVVYTADQKGTVRALDAATGNVRWKAELGQEFTRCPVVTDKQVILGCRSGKLAVLNRADGAEVWSKQVASRFSYEPVVLGDRMLYFEGNAVMLASLADGSAAPVQIPVRRGREEELQPATISSDPLTSISYYKGRLFFVSRCEHEEMYLNYPWHLLGGRFYVLSPKEEEKK